MDNETNSEINKLLKSLEEGIYGSSESARLHDLLEKLGIKAARASFKYEGIAAQVYHSPVINKKIMLRDNLKDLEAEVESYMKGSE